MKSTNERRGRPKEGESEPILEYTQTFKEHTGEKFIWKWDKNKYPNSPYSVEIFDPQYSVSEKLLKDIDILESKYTQKPGERKPRITKVDSVKLEELKKQLENEHYRFYPEDRKGYVKPKKTNKNPKKKI